MSNRGSPKVVRLLVLAAALVTACVCVAGAAAGGGSSGQDRLAALYSIDHPGKQPSPAALKKYAAPFGTIVRRCGSGPEALTQMALDLADQASTNGARNVSSLQVLQHVATLLRLHSTCLMAFSVAESNLEAGMHGPTPAELQMARRGSIG